MNDKDREKFVKDLKKMRKVNLEAFKPKMIYSQDYDMLSFVFNGEEDVEHTIEVGNFIRFDINKQDEVVGIEIENFSEFLEKAKNKKGYGVKK